MQPLDSDLKIVSAALAQARTLRNVYGDEIPWSAIEGGLQVDGEKVFIANRARGIFKPRQLSRGLLSIKTTEPREGRTNIYSDQETNEGFFRYSLQSGDASGGGNKFLWEAHEDHSPFIYFHAVAEGIYKAIWPCYVTRIHPEQMYCEVVVGLGNTLSSGTSDSLEYKIPSPLERSYALRETKIRLYQATFRENVLTAYQCKCAISGLPIKSLLEAAHITPDSDAESSTEVSNGIALSRLHHRAYDANLIGISPDLKIVVSQQLLESKDGPLLQALKDSHGQTLKVPREKALHPNRDRLAMRFALFGQ